MSPFDFIECVVLVCSKHRGSVSSWGRTPKHNKDVGGVDDSTHMLWIGCDVVLDNMVKNPAFEEDVHILGLHWSFEGDHYHLQTIPAK
jgi:hypothetical protein